MYLRRSLLAALAVVAAACDQPSLARTYPLTADVLSVMEHSRLFELRLTRRQAWESCTPADSTRLLPRAVCARTNSDIGRELAALSPRVAAALKSPDTDVLWAAALLDLWSGRDDPRRLDRAIARLIEVRARDSTLAAVVNHLAVAHVARANLRGDARDLFASADAIEQAMAMDSVAPEITFNRGVLLGYIRADRQAARFWVVRTESARDWRDESATRRAAADARVATRPYPADWTAADVERDPQGAREYVLDSLIPRWVDAAGSTDREASSAVVMAIERIGATLAKRSDSSVAHIAGDLRRDSGPAFVYAVGEAVGGIRDYALARFNAVGPRLSAVVPVLDADQRYALADWANSTRAGALMNSGDFPGAIRIFESVNERANRRGDRALLARAHMGLGIAVARSRSMDEAEGLVVTARKTFAEIGEARSVASLDAILSEIYGFLGRTSDAASAAYRAFSSGTRIRYEDHLAFARRLAEDGWTRAAVVQLKEGSLAAAASPREKDVPEALGRLAEGEALIGQLEDAGRTLDSAWTRAKLVTDPEMRDRLDAELHRAASQVEFERNPVLARASLDSSALYFTKIPVELAALHSQRSRLSLALRDSATAEQDLSRSIALVRDMSESQLGSAPRATAELLRDAQRTLVALALARADTLAAFRHTLVGAGESPGDASGFAPTASDAELRYVVLPDRLVVWFRMKEQLRAASMALTRQALGAQVARFVNLVRTGDDSLAVRNLASTLFAELLGPFQHELRTASRIDIVPDDVLHDLPFAVLVDGEGRFLLERTATRVVTGGIGRRSSGKRGNGGHLLVADPQWDRAMFPDLEPLRWANREVASIDSLYVNAAVLSNRGASKAALVGALAQARLLHFAGHARVVGGRGSTSHLVLSASGRGFANDVLFASEISALALDHVELVVLSACGPAGSTNLPEGHSNALAQAFLESGAGAVMASRWSVDDEGTATLMRAVHAGLSQGLAPDEALRRAQVEGLRSIPQSILAGFTVFVPNTR